MAPAGVCCRWDVLAIQDARGRTRSPQHFKASKDVIETCREWYERAQTDRQVLWFKILANERTYAHIFNLFIRPLLHSRR